MEGSIEHLIKGDVISVPFSDIFTTKKRPAFPFDKSFPLIEIDYSI